ncbi:MAG: DUF4332 domain-containing protein [Caldilineaceae bacterium]|nr:DUF4332 domain-containing protein [Caldilineaceae bacterium]
MTPKRRTPFKLREFRGVDPEVVAQFEAYGIKTAEQLLMDGATRPQRAALAAATDVPEAIILELVKLSDLARLPGVKGIRARLYYDAGVDSVAQMATWEPEALRQMLIVFVERTGFAGVPPLPKEVSSTIANAQKLPKVVEDEI